MVSLINKDRIVASPTGLFISPLHFSRRLFSCSKSDYHQFWFVNFFYIICVSLKHSTEITFAEISELLQKNFVFQFLSLHIQRIQTQSSFKS